MFSKILEFFRKITKVRFIILVSSLLFCSFSMCFLSGIANPSVKVEETAEYAANIAKNHTKNGKYAALIVEPKDGSDKNLIDSGLELYSLYGVFRENIASFASVVNADHKHNVRFKDIDTDNLSFLYVTSGFNTVEYHGHYKHEYYPLEAMFMREKDEEQWGQKSFGSLLYISQSHADKLLDVEGLPHTESNYKSLLKTHILMTIDGVEKEWQIEDIFLETNYFFDAVTECAGEFVFAWSSDGYTQNVKKQSMYFLSSYTFRNSFYFDYATSLYPLSDFNYTINDYNFKDGFHVDASRLIFAVNASDTVLSIFIIIFGSIILFTAFAFLYLTPTVIEWWQHLIFAVSAFSPYLLFKLIFIITGRVIVFSTYSTNANIIMLMISIVIYFVILFIRKRRKNASVVG